MSDVSVKKSAVFGVGKGDFIHVLLNAAEDKPLDDKTPPLELKIGATSGTPVKIGSAGSAKLSIAADASASLTPIFDSTVLKNAADLKATGLEGFFATNPTEMLLLLKLGADASADVSAAPQFGAINTSIDLKAGVDASYLYVRSFPTSEPARDVITDFFSEFTVPSALGRALHPDETLVFEFGGSAELGVTVSAGYKLAGARSFDVNNLAITENFGFSLLARVALSAQFAGRFNIEVRPAEKDADKGWALVAVKKSDKRAFSIGAGIEAGADFTSEGVPDTAKQFLEAVLGLRAKNWINYFQRAQQLTDPGELKALLDNLADGFIEKWLGKAFRPLQTAEAKAFFARIQKALDSYDHVGDRAVALFDHFAGPLVSQLSNVLAELNKIQSWTELEGKILDGPIAEALSILTDGKILDLLAAGDSTIEQLKAEVQKAIDLLTNDAHEELRKLIATAKQEFGLDKLADLLRQADPAKLQSIADKRIVGFAERLIGESIDKLTGSTFGKAVKDINTILGKIDSFTETFYGKLKDALNQSFKADIHAAYNSAVANQTLLSCELNLNTAEGRRLMGLAGVAQFRDLLTATNPDVIRKLNADLVRTISRQSTVTIDLQGWHDQHFHYSSIRNMVVNADQHVQSTPSGLSITTDIDLNLSKDRKRQNERLTTALILDFAGVSQGGKQFDNDSSKFLIDRIGGMSGSYSLVRSDDSTTEEDLRSYLALMQQLGFSTPPDALSRLLPRDAAGNFGKVNVDYEVRFSEAGLQAIFEPAGDVGTVEATLRKTMRQLVLANCVTSVNSSLVKRGWAYSSNLVFLEWTKEFNADALQFVSGITPRTFPIGSSILSGFTAPAVVSLTPQERQLVQNLFLIERDTLAAFHQLLELRQNFTPNKFQDTLAAFGSALNSWERFSEGDSTILSLFDRLVQLSGAPHARDARVTVTTTTKDPAGKDLVVTKMLFA